MIGVYNFLTGRGCLRLKVLFLMIVAFVLECVFFRLNIYSFSIPALYGGGDEFLGTLLAQNVIDTGWGWYNTRLASPSYLDYLAFPSESLLRNFDVILFKIIGAFGFNAFQIVGIVLLMEPLICVLTAYFALRSVIDEDWLSAIGALTFAFMPFYWQRFLPHMCLTMYMFVPLAILMCVWLYKGEIFQSIDRCELYNRKNWLSGMFCLLIANNGIAYWQAFSCFFLFMTALFCKGMTETWKSVLPRFIPVGIIILLFAIELSPVVIDKYLLDNHFESPVRVAVEPEIFGLKVSQMLIPQQLPGDTGYERGLQEYFRNAPLSNENNTAYLGVTGAVGFLILIGSIFFAHAERGICNLLAKLNLAGFLLATIGGFSTIGTLVVFGYRGTFLRGYNRISVFLGLISIMGFCMFVQSLINSKPTARIRWRIGIAILMLAGLSFQSWVACGGQRGAWGSGLESYESDRAFVSAIENRLPKGAMIYQLPYHPFPEAGPVKKMNDYQHLTGVLHSKDLRWSYGTIRGTEADEWQKKLAGKDIVSQIELIKEVGYAGIYLDRRAYDQNELNNIEGALRKIVNGNPLVSKDKNLVFYQFNNIL